MKKYIDEIINLSKKSLETCDVPIGAIIIYKDSIIGKGVNTRESKNSVLGHAEINAILEASSALNGWNLEECEMYVTLKPCSMCEEIIKQSRISKVYYLLDKPSSKKEYSKTKFTKIDSEFDEKKYNKILSDFFKDLREKSN